MRQHGVRKLGYRAAGMAFLLVMALLITLSVQVYEKRFESVVAVTLEADRIGNQLDENSEVKARGVLVGEVRQVQTGRDGAEITLALEPDTVDRLPQDVEALLVPKTLFGKRYVQLSIPEGSTAPALSDGDLITQDRSESAIELQEVFDELLPVLTAVQPQKLSSTLSAVSTALDGRGEQIGDTLATAAEYLEEFNPNLPELNDSIRDLAEVSRIYGDIAPDVLDALTDAAVTLDTAVEKRDELDVLYARMTASSQRVETFLRTNRENLIDLAAHSREPLEVAAHHAPSFPCTLQAMNQFKPSMDQVLGAGSDRAPGLHLEASVTESRGKYEPGVDDPAYTKQGDPQCYPLGVAPGEGQPPAPLENEDSALPVGDDDLGLPNSPQERELINGLVAPEVELPPAEVPEWSSVLVGPLYRGAEVTLE